MKSKASEREDWERLLSTAALVQDIIPEAILVGGTAAALHAEHRFSEDDGHVICDLKERFDVVLERLESVSGWKTNRVSPPVLILGNLRGVETGIRQLRRSEPLETTVVQSAAGSVKIPTLPEMLRIKAWLVVTRNATRDYIDTAALAERLDMESAAAALQSLDTLYSQENGASVSMQLARQLSEPMPYDLGDADLSQYRLLSAKWSHWDYVSATCAELGTRILYQAD